MYTTCHRSYSFHVIMGCEFVVMHLWSLLGSLKSAQWHHCSCSSWVPIPYRELDLGLPDLLWYHYIIMSRHTVHQRHYILCSLQQPIFSLKLNAMHVICSHQWPLAAYPVSWLALCNRREPWSRPSYIMETEVWNSELNCTFIFVQLGILVWHSWGWAVSNFDL